MWDYGKELNLTLEDALMSLESMRLMMGGKDIKKPTTAAPIIVNLTEQATVAVKDTAPTLTDHLDASITYTLPDTYHYINLTTGVRGEVHPADEEAEPPVEAATFHAEKGDLVRFFWEQESTQENTGFNAYEITISPNTFPGTYKVVGDTFIRSEKTGKDEAFQFIIGKAKVLSNVTITLEAEGDPSTFEMQLNVLRSTNERGEYEMMKLVRYGTQPSA